MYPCDVIVKLKYLTETHTHRGWVREREREIENLK